MDELKEMWKSIENNRFSDAIPSERDFYQPKQASINLIAKLAYMVKIKLLFAVSIALFFVVITPLLDYWPTQLLLVLLIIAYVAGSYVLYKEYQILKTGIDHSLDLKTALSQYLDRVKKVLAMEERIALFLYPISFSAGFLLGAWEAAGNDEHIQETSFWLILLATVAVVTPLCRLLANWMNRISFGKVIERVEAQIQEMERF